MKISIDSSDSLDDALRLVGALYGVTLQVGGAAESANGSADGAARSRSSRSQNGRATSRAGRARRSTGGRRTSRRRTPTATDVRQWARDNGMAVNDRGRIPTAVQAAFREANSR
jgi:hypothetical protein